MLNVHILSSEDKCFTTTLAPKLKMLVFVKLSFNIRDHTIMIVKMSFKCLYFFYSIAERRI